MTADERDAHVSESEVEIAADPAEVWRAIATESGVAAWFFPADIEPGEGGTVRLHRGPFAPDASAVVTAWEPPHRLAYEERGQAPSPTIATEFLVEARERGTCVVRVVSGIHADGEGWDHLAEEAGAGWLMSLRLLRAYVTHFAGLPSARLDLSVPAGAPSTARVEVTTELKDSLGLTGLAEGDEFRTPEGAPALTGTVEHLGPYFLLLRGTAPAPALFAISSFPMDGVRLSVNVTGRVYGPGADSVARRELPRWRDWLTFR
ncbi:SRPBCC domain-containing protein [Prauserella sp. PE36]|uniref:SRPBCC domain-containing protein n=1 Tax=Prauserella endophytica TaxID=1592324 RepID=A0ABY2S828_9PSEU|nr:MULTISPECIES: SRPBCC domain-containing protein [Prauserella]RBM22698.1 SRPBCC domain-containing protein [Prauserella sp. PE36]TKG72053.1 SRPBCC domain-containing protein [Prauserella endophytica]